MLCAQFVQGAIPSYDDLFIIPAFYFHSREASRAKWSRIFGCPYSVSPRTAFIRRSEEAAAAEFPVKGPCPFYPRVWAAGFCNGAEKPRRKCGNKLPGGQLVGGSMFSPAVRAIEERVCIKRERKGAVEERRLIIFFFRELPQFSLFSNPFVGLSPGFVLFRAKRALSYRTEIENSQSLELR